MITTQTKMMSQCVDVLVGMFEPSMPKALGGRFPPPFPRPPQPGEATRRAREQILEAEFQNSETNSSFRLSPAKNTYPIAGQRATWDCMKNSVVGLRRFGQKTRSPALKPCQASDNEN